LGILNQKNHQKCDDSCASVNHQLPSVAVMKNWASDNPNQDDANRNDKYGRASAKMGRFFCEL
jgi:hypothetical protein